MGWQFSTQLIHRDKCSQMLNSLTCHVSTEKQSSLEKFIYLQNEHFNLVFLFFSGRSTALDQLNKPTRRANNQTTNITIIYTMGAAGNTLWSEFFMNQFQILIKIQSINQQNLSQQLFNQLWLYTFGNVHKLKCV